MAMGLFAFKYMVLFIIEDSSKYGNATQNYCLLEASAWSYSTFDQGGPHSRPSLKNIVSSKYTWKAS